MLRIYQHLIIEQIESMNVRRILGILPTGAGKTICMAELFNRHGGPGAAIAHRQELIKQITAAVDPEIDVFSVDKLLKHPELLGKREIIQIDEAHHVQDDNKWGRILPSDVLIIGWTATPVRTDKRRLPWDAWVQGPSPSDLVNLGYITPVEIYAPPSGFDRSSVVRGASGEFSRSSLVSATRRAPIIGNVVDHYLRVRPGALGVTFCVDVESARDQVSAFSGRGVPAALLEAGSKQRARDEVDAAFRRGDIKQVCNVDILGEGYDMPGIEVVSMARATESLGLCWQQIGRCRRPSPGKRCGVVLDHVGNILRHGLPDSLVCWDETTGRARRAGTDWSAMPVRQCYGPGCWRVFEGWGVACPYCGWRPASRQASRPVEVEGDLTLYSRELLDQLSSDAASAVSGPPGRQPRTPRERVMWQHMQRRRDAQLELRSHIDHWMIATGGPSSHAYREFYLTYGVDVATARTLSGPEAEKLICELKRRH